MQSSYVVKQIIQTEIFTHIKVTLWKERRRLCHNVNQKVLYFAGPLLAIQLETFEIILNMSFWIWSYGQTPVDEIVCIQSEKYT